MEPVDAPSAPALRAQCSLLEPRRQRRDPGMITRPSQRVSETLNLPRGCETGALSAPSIPINGRLISISSRLLLILRKLLEVERLERDMDQRVHCNLD